MLPPFEKTPVRNPEVWAVQDRLLVTLGALGKVPLLDGVLLKSVSLTTSFQNFAHTLGRTPVGWLVVGKNANSDVWETPTARNERFLNLRGSAAVLADLWVF
jgi:hypothetical protein